MGVVFKIQSLRGNQQKKGQLVYTTSRNHEHQIYHRTYGGKFLHYQANRLIVCNTFGSRCSLVCFVLR